MGRPVGGQQGVLDGVSRLLPVPQRPQCDGPQPVPVALDELAEGVGIAIYVTRQEVLIAGIAVFGVVHPRTPSPS